MSNTINIDTDKQPGKEHCVPLEKVSWLFSLKKTKQNKQTTRNRHAIFGHQTLCVCTIFTNHHYHYLNCRQNLNFQELFLPPPHIYFSLLFHCSRYLYRFIFYYRRHFRAILQLARAYFCFKIFKYFNLLTSIILQVTEWEMIFFNADNNFHANFSRDRHCVFFPTFV